MSSDAATVIKQIEAFVIIEKQAEALYSAIYSQLKDKPTTAVIKKIRNDEIDHQKLWNEILVILKAAYPTVESYVEPVNKF
jgi:rubrerythrin